MPRAICRCGQPLDVPARGEGRVVCPACGAKVRVRRASPASAQGAGDGYIRFTCPCGRRLKVSAADPPSHGKCPDCDRVVPVPAASTAAPGDPEAPTAELSPEDRAELERWAAEHKARA